MTHSVTTREPEFTSSDVSLLVAARKRSAEVGTHGVSMMEATDPENQFAFEGYVMRDWAEKARQDKYEQLRKTAPDDPLHGVIVGVRKR